jgi:hypothetical protein
MELLYSLDECIDRERVVGRLELLKLAGKLYYDIEYDILEIEDLDLSDDELDKLLKLLDKNDVIEYTERENDIDKDDFLNEDY